MRWESAGEGDYTVETVAQGRARHRRHPAPAAGRGRAAVRLARCARSCASTPTTSPCPILMKKEQWDADAKAAGRHRRGRAGQPGVGAVGAAQVGDHRGAVPRVLQARRARLRAAAGLQPREGRGPPGVHAAALHPAARAVRPVGSRASPRHQAVRPARLHHGRRRAADAGVPAVRPRRHRLERPAAQRLARNPAAVAGRARRSARRRSSACSACSTTSATTPAGEVRDVLEGVRPRVQGRRRRGRRQQGADRQAAALRVDPRDDATSRPCRWPTTSAG